jgi:hypothetical protein
MSIGCQSDLMLFFDRSLLRHSLDLWRKARLLTVNRVAALLTVFC